MWPGGAGGGAGQQQQQRVVPLTLVTHLPISTPALPGAPAARGARLLRLAAQSSSGGGGGAAVREVLTPGQRQKLDASDDREFYSQPRLVHHLDANFRAQLTQLYRERIPLEGAVVCDLCSSWVSHLPPEGRYSRVVGHGMNAAELARNPQLSEFVVRNLNREPGGWAFADASFDAVVCCASVQYLAAPEAVFAEVRRVVKPGGVVIFAFSNRMFYQKAGRGAEGGEGGGGGGEGAGGRALLRWQSVAGAGCMACVACPSFSRPQLVDGLLTEGGSRLRMPAAPLPCCCGSPTDCRPLLPGGTTATTGAANWSGLTLRQQAASQRQRWSRGSNCRGAARGPWRSCSSGWSG